MERLQNRNPVWVQASHEAVYGQTLFKLDLNRHWVSSDLRIQDLADSFEAFPEVLAVGVVDEQGRCLGAVTRSHLFTQLGKPFGRDVLARRPVREVVEDLPRFGSGSNLFSVAAQLQTQMDRSVVSWYLVVDEGGRFKGLFSSQDLLLFLSHMTQSDLQLAGDLQDRLVPPRQEWMLPGGRLEAWSRFAKGVGGDFYFAAPSDQGPWFGTLCDVSGKGTSASLITCLIWGMLRMHEPRRGLRFFLHQLNLALIQTFQLEKYVTGVFFLFDPETRSFIWADMGHSHVLIKRQGRVKPLRMTRTNLPLGLDPHQEALLCRAILKPGDQILLFTDGLTEQVNHQGAEWGEAALIELLTREHPERLVTALELAWNAHRGEIPAQDDTSLMHLALTLRSN